MTDFYQPCKGDKFEHARHLDLEWTPGPGETWAGDAPHRVYTVTCVRNGNVWFGVTHGAFTATVAQMQEGGLFVKRWLPREGDRATYAVRLDGFPNDKLPFIRRGNAYPQVVATYDTRDEAQAMADKCPKSYKARVVEMETA